MRRVLHTLALLFVLILPSGLFGASPGDVSGNLQLWLKADAGITTSGSSVSKWEDQTSNGFDAEQSTSSQQPTHHLNRANFNPALEFVQTNKNHLDIQNQNQIITSRLAKLNGKKLTVFVVDKVIGGSSWRSPWTSRDDTGSNGSHNTKGHLLYYKDSNYRYWVGKGSGGGWAALNGSDTTGGYEIVTTTSKRASNTEVKRYIYQQGKETAGPLTSAFSPNTQRPFRIGGGATEDTPGNYFWSGDITEVIVYNKKLEDTPRHKIESYLAIKYGITLDQSNGGQDYHHSGNTVVWSAADNSGYGYDIAGLAKDTQSQLDQRVSHSISDDAIVIMSTDTDFSSKNPGGRPKLSTKNRRYLIWSNNNGEHSWTTTGAPAGGEILQRTWKVQRTGNKQHKVNIQVDVDDPDFDIDNFNGDLYFVQHKDDLSKAVPQKMTHDVGGKWHIENITFKKSELFGFVIPPQTIPDANLIINEVLYNEPNNGEHKGEEFIEFYAKDGGEIKGMILSDQDNQIEYRFPSNCTVQQGDYIVMHRIDGSQNDSCTPGGVSHFYLNNATSTQRLGNGKDDVVLLRPSTNDKTTLADGHLFFAVPVDYISWGSKNNSGSNYDDPPTSDAGVTVSWDNSQNNRLNHEADGQSISLTRNAIDSDTSKCWEPTATTTTAYKADDCQNYLPTRDTNTDPDLTYSMGENNNAMPDMHITKTSIVISDPVNTTNNPKRIPGAIVRYCFTVKNTGDGNGDNVAIHDTLTGNNREKLTYKQSGKLGIVANGNDCTSADCAGISDTTGSYDSGTKKVDINLTTPFPPGNHQCAYIKVEIK